MNKWWIVNPYLSVWENEADSMLKQAPLYTFQSFNYPMVVPAIDISSINSKGFHCMHLKFFNCNMQGSALW